MTDDRLKLVVLAALLHDVGKPLERGEIFKEARKDELYLESCPDAKGNTHHTHLHAAHTAAFLDWLEQRFDCLRSLPDKDWKTWCASHHRNDMTGMEESVVRISDRLSSAERDEGTYYQKDIHRRTLLEPVLERVSIDGAPAREATSFRYPPARLASDRQSLFPVEGTELRVGGRSLGLKKMPGAEGPVADPKAWSHLVAENSDLIVEAYASLCQGLMSEIDALSEKCPDLPLGDLLVCLTTLLERYFSNVPSATNLRNPDIGLFDHLRTAAAIAQALYLHLEHDGRKMVALPQDDPEPRWILACGDFSGIQKFIYNLTNKGAAKGLRGRSFYVSHFCRVCADFILRELGLTRAALLYNSGGKFYLLLPAHLEKNLRDVRARVNEGLLEEFGGDVFFGMGLAPVSARMFSMGNMHEAWKEAALDLERDRLRKFLNKGTFPPGFFEPRQDIDPTKPCRVCGSQASAQDKELDEVERDGETVFRCSACKKTEKLGKVVADTAAVVTLYGEGPDERRFLAKMDEDGSRTFELPSLHLRYLMVPEDRLDLLAGERLDGHCSFVNPFADASFKKLSLPKCGVSSLYLGKWKKTAKEGAGGGSGPWDFGDYAANVGKESIERLGILRMDVDNLGMIFIRGLEFPERENKGWGAAASENGRTKRRKMASISRMATLSRQLDHFFCGYLPVLLEQPDFEDCQIVYAGGDDLFIIGPWDRLPELAATIRSEFRRFCCLNPSFSISGGMTLQRAKYPIYKGAQLSGAAEKAAKEARSQWDAGSGGHQKDGFCFLGVPILWEDFPMARKIKKLLEEDIRENRGLLSFLSRMTVENKALAEEARRTTGAGVAKAWDSIAWGPWRWRTAYHLRRRFKRDEQKIETWSRLLFANQCENNESKLPVYAWLEMPLRWTQFLHRRQGG